MSPPGSGRVVRRGVKDYPLIMPIRLLTLLEAEEADPTLKDRLARLMDHNTEREQESERWDWVDRTVVQPLLKLNNNWSKHDIHRCIGLFRTNACTTQANIVRHTQYLLICSILREHPCQLSV